MPGSYKGDVSFVAATTAVARANPCARRASRLPERRKHERTSRSAARRAARMAARSSPEFRRPILRFALSPVNRSVFVAHLQPTGIGYRPPPRTHTQALAADPAGAVTYVIAVVSFWSLSILFLIVSYVRKNRVDRNVSLYLKQIQMVRSRSDREKVINYVNSLWREDNQQQQQQQQQPPQRPQSSTMPFLSPRQLRCKAFRQTYPPPKRPRRLHRIALPAIFVEESGPDTATSDNVSTASDISAKDDTILC